MVTLGNMGGIVKRLIIIAMMLFAATSVCQADTVKAYLSLDELTEQELPVFQEISGKFFVEYSLINIRNDRRFYIGLIRDTEQIASFLNYLAIKSPSVIGVFSHSGLTYGLQYTTDPETGEQITTGEVIYPFKIEEYLSLMPDIKTYDIDGTELSSSRPTVVKPLKNFGGWGKCVFQRFVDAPDHFGCGRSGSDSYVGCSKSNRR